MEAPGEDELQWMAQLEEDDLRQEADVFFNYGGMLATSVGHDPQDPLPFAEEAVAEEPEEISGKRKRLVFPDINLSPLKAQKTCLEACTSSRQSLEANDSEELSTVSGPEEPAELEYAASKMPHKRAADIPGEFVPVTGPSGERVYAKFQQHNMPPCFSSRAQLLPETIQKIMERIELEQFEQMCKMADKEDTGKDDVSESCFHQLWVDKYAPKSFTELLSDERNNREILSWLKQWDPCVFGKKPLRKYKSTVDSGNVDKEALELDRDRPEQKVILLCGPPGLGKTTSAHVAARHCGYRTVEINASDDRTAGTFQLKVLDAVQMKPVLGDYKPNCLVIDEIDGASSGVEGKSCIDFLIRLISAGARDGVPTDDVAGKGKQGKKKSTRKLSRPIICICNDLYAPALRPLREIARVFLFAPPSPHRIVTRLKFICKMEDYKVDPRALTALAIHTECDIRSCLNTLQFLNRRGEALKALDVASQIIGKKDMTSRMFDLWLETFCKRKAKPGSIESIAKEQGQFERLHDLFANHGEHDLAIEGIYENVHCAQYYDAHLEKTIACLDLIVDSDILGRRTISQQQFFLNGYRPAFMIAIQRLIAQPRKPKLQWPGSFQRLRQQLANAEVLSAWFASISPAIARSISCACLVQDTLSPFLSILAPAIRPVASQLRTEQEMERIKELVDTMITYGLSYKNVKRETSEGWALYPPLFSFISYKDHAHRHPQLPLALHQIVNHEIEMEVIRRNKRQRADVKAASQESSVLSTIVSKAVIVSKVTTKKQLVARTVKTVKQTSSFFDRFTKACASKPAAQNKTLIRDARPLLYKYHEGFTNAVKRPVYMKDLL